jgi:aryl-alcohol dehydrogenase-like predicted oxidoreductase
MRPIAQAHGASVARVTLAWLVRQRAVTSVIVGARTTEQLTDNLAATELVLGAQETAALDETSARPQEYPRWMLELQSANRAAVVK